MEQIAYYYYHKTNNPCTFYAPGTVVYETAIISLDRKRFSKSFLKKFPCANGTWGAWWYIGIDQLGNVKALPHSMSIKQCLPSGANVHHSGFMIPPGLKEMSRHSGLGAISLSGKKFDKDCVNRFVANMFILDIARAAAALSGINVLIKKDNVSARLGLPISSLKEFFRDRDTHGERKKPIVHFMPQHERRMSDGRIIEVGEHVRGNRSFMWRGYDITINIPGIDAPLPEAFTPGSWTVGENFPAVPHAEDLVPIKTAAKQIAKMQWDREPSKFKHGEPIRRFPADALPNR